jgi:hypothetical protein
MVKCPQPLIWQRDTKIPPFTATRKQTQSNPIQTQNKAIFTPKNPLKPKTNPIQTQSPRRHIVRKSRLFCGF